MNKTEKIEFIRDLTKSVTDGIIEKIDQIPAGWDGHELRQLLADKFDGQRSLISRGRKRDYKNTVAVNNL